MVMNNDFVIYRKMLDVTKWNFGRVITFPKKQRFVLGQQIENSCVNCLRLIIEANGSNAGVMYLNLNNSPANTNTNIGFRVASPV